VPHRPRTHVTIRATPVILAPAGAVEPPGLTSVSHGPLVDTRSPGSPDPDGPGGRHWNPLDSFYVALMSLTTVGYGEVHPLSRSGQIVASALMLTGAIAMLVGIGVVVDLIVELELTDYAGRGHPHRDR